jgi:hypothetical protein
MKNKITVIILTIILIPIILLGCKNTNQNIFKTTKSSPVIVIKSVIQPKIPESPLEIDFELKVKGISPVAIEEKNFGVVIKSKNNLLITSNPSFLNDKRQVFLIQPEHTLRLRAAVLSDREDKNKTWYSLPYGEYDLRIYIWTGKTLEFDYQWLGQTYSNDYKFIIGKNAK